MGGWIHLAVKPNSVSFKRKPYIGQKAFQNNKKRRLFFWLFFADPHHTFPCQWEKLTMYFFIVGKIYANR